MQNSHITYSKGGGLSFKGWYILSFSCHDAIEAHGYKWNINQQSPVVHMLIHMEKMAHKATVSDQEKNSPLWYRVITKHDTTDYH